MLSSRVFFKFKFFEGRMNNIFLLRDGRITFFMRENRRMLRRNRRRNRRIMSHNISLMVSTLPFDYKYFIVYAGQATNSCWAIFP